MDREMAEVLASEAARMELEGERERHYVQIKPAKEPSQVYSVRIPVARLEELRNIAKTYGQTPSSLLREWVLERLSVETSRLDERPVAASSRPKLTFVDSESARTLVDELKRTFGQEPYAATG